MSQLIYFRLGERDRVSFGTLLNMMTEVKRLLSDFDAAMSHDPRGAICWEVAVLEKKSPVTLGVLGELIERRDRVQMPAIFPDQVKSEFMLSTARLSHSAERGSVVSDSALGHYRNLAAKTPRVGEITVYTDEKRIPINETTLHHITQLTGTKSKSVGSILGRLDTISVHKSNEIRVWDDNANRPVRCKYPESLEETVKALLRKRVLVGGQISYNEFGRPISLDVATIEEYARDEDLPTIEEMKGSIKDVTGGASLASYLEHLRDG